MASLSAVTAEGAQTATSASTQAAAERASIRVFTENPVTRDASIGVLVKNLRTGEILAAHNENTVLTPASTMKLISTCTALELLGGDYRFQTFLETDGSVQDGVLRGNLYIRGGSDPSLGSYKVGDRGFMNKWVAALQKAGIRQIDGDIVADMTLLSAEGVNPGWVWEDIGNYYAPGIYALAYLDNTMNITLRSGAVGTKAEVLTTYPDYPGIAFENQILCAAQNTDGAFVHGLPLDDRRFLVGTVPANQGSFGLKGDLPNPGWLLALHLKRALATAGIRVSGEADYRVGLPARGERTLLYTHSSYPLRDLVRETNMQSNNHYAEQIFRLLGTRAAVPASIQNALDVELQCWRGRGVDLGSARIVDGCGLSPSNAVSPRQFVDLLTYMNGSPNQADFYASLPVSGQTGTLRGLLGGTALEGRVHAKSGTIGGVKTYAGYLEMPNGDRLAFAVMVNNSVGKMKVAQGIIARYLLALYDEIR